LGQQIVTSRPEPSQLENDYLMLVAPHEVQLRAEMARRNLFCFVKEFWPTIVSDPFLDNWHIKYICDELQIVLERVIKRQPKEYDLIINVPPGTSKSTIFTKMAPVWLWTRDPTASTITGSYALDLSLELADKSRDIIMSQKFHSYYPWLKIREKHDNKSEYQIAFQEIGKRSVGKRYENGGTRYTTSVGGTITGQHGHAIFIDDPINPKQAEATSDINRDAANSWMDRTVSTRTKDKEVTPTCIIMQRLHQDDPTAHRLNLHGIKTKHISLPGEIVGEINEVTPPELASNYVDGLLDPVRLSRRVLDDLKVLLGPYGYAGQVLQRPVPPGGGMFKIAKFIILASQPPQEKEIQDLWYWDKAGTQDGGDYTVGVLMAQMRKTYPGPKYIIKKVVRGQWGPAPRENIIKREAQVTGFRTYIYVEQEPGSAGKDSVAATVKNLAGYRVKADPPTGKKEIRAEPLCAQVEMDNVGIVNGPWVEPFLKEAEFFPFGGKYDDQIDAASGAFNALARVKRVGTW